MFSKGQLGNQFFQLNALLAVKKTGEPALLFGFSEARSIVRIEKAILIYLPKFAHGVIPNTFEKMLRKLGKFRIFGRIMLGEGDAGFTKKDGLFPIFTFDQDWFQGWQFLNEENRLNFCMEPPLSSQLDFWNKLENRACGSHLVFVHVRRGDYLDWPKGINTSLPDSYFEQQMKFLNTVIKNPVFVVFSDDPDYCNRIFGTRSDTVVVPPTDAIQSLAMMSRCSAGILSASTFSWWAARLASEGALGPWVAPEGWTNWHGKRPEPEIPRVSFLDFVKVAAEHRNDQAPGPGDSFD